MRQQKWRRNCIKLHPDGNCRKFELKLFD
jgi:hypothetical protein